MPSLLQRGLGSLSAAMRGRTSHPRGRPHEPRLIPGAAIAPELCMLPTDTSEADIASLRQVVVQLKVDGIRALWIGGRILTREGTPFDAALHCEPALARLEAAFGEPMMFDGEYVEEEGFDATVTAFKRREGNGVLWLFDAIPMHEWRGEFRQPALNQVQRLERLRTHLLAADSPFVGMLDHWVLSGHQAIAKARELWAEGYEGIVIKAVGATYHRDRTNTWQRLKRVFTVDAPIVDVIAKDGKLKSIMVRTEHGPLRIGTGWTEADGKALHDAWTFQPDGDAQLMAEISYQLSTGVKRSIRGARFHRLRWDKGQNQ